MQLSLVPAFRRGHGALYDALAAGRIDEEALALLLTATLPPLADGEEGRAWVARHDQIDYGLLEAALDGVPADQAAQVREACARWTRRRFAVDATPYPRPDAECSPERGHVHHDACRCDGTRKTIPGWEYQFVAAVGHLRTAWAALIDVERTTPATRTRQTARQVQHLLRRLAAGPRRGRAAGHPRRRVQRRRADAALAGQPVHLLIRLPAGSVFYADPVTWPGKRGRPGKHGMAVTRAAEPGQANPEPDESLVLPDTPLYGTVRVAAWHQVHPLIHGDRGWFADWDGNLPVLRGTVLRVRVERLPDGRIPPKTMWLWHALPAAVARSAMARLPGPLRRRACLPVPEGNPRADRRQGPHPRTSRPVGPPGHGRLRPAGPRPAAGRRPAPPLGTAPRPGQAWRSRRVRRGFPDIRPRLGTPARVGKPTRPGPGRPKARPAARQPATQSRRKAAKRTNKKPKTALNRLKPKLRACRSAIELAAPGADGGSRTRLAGLEGRCLMPFGHIRAVVPP